MVTITEAELTTNLTKTNLNGSCRKILTILDNPRHRLFDKYGSMLLEQNTQILDSFT